MGHKGNNQLRGFTASCRDPPTGWLVGIMRPRSASSLRVKPLPDCTPSDARHVKALALRGLEFAPLL